MDGCFFKLFRLRIGLVPLLLFQVEVELIKGVFAVLQLQLSA
jgi:hypothetical protein